MQRRKNKSDLLGQPALGHRKNKSELARGADHVKVGERGLHHDHVGALLERTGVLIGSGIGGVEGIAENALILHERGPRRISPFFIPGNIIIRQRGTRYHAGINAGLGKDHTIFALAEGKVAFNTRGPRGGKVYVDIVAA